MQIRDQWKGGVALSRRAHGALGSDCLARNPIREDNTAGAVDEFDLLFSVESARLDTAPNLADPHAREKIGGEGLRRVGG